MTWVCQPGAPEQILIRTEDGVDMGRRMTRRVLTGGPLAVLVLLLMAVLATPAWADSPDQITVTGDELAEPWVVDPQEHPQEHKQLLSEVEWLLDRRADIPEPAPETLGPRYTLVLHVEGTAQHQLELYPLAEGGPKVFRPKQQPGDRTVSAAWFLARLSLPETLREVGVGLPGDPDGGGGGSAEGMATSTPTARPDRLAFLTEWWDGVLLAAGATTAILAGTASIAFLIRREP